MVAKIILYFIVLIAIVSCKGVSNKAIQIVDELDVNCIEKVFEKHPISPILFYPKGIIETDSFIIVLNEYDNKFFNCFDKIDNYKYIGSFLSKGKGPNEVNRIDASTLFFKKGIINFSDAMNYYSLKLEDMSLNKIRIPGSFIPFNRVMKFKDSILTFENEKIEKKNNYEYVNYDINSSNDNCWGAFPELIKLKSSQLSMKMNIYSKTIAIKPDQNAFVACYLYFPVIRIYKDSKLYKEKMLKVNNNPIFFDKGEYQNSESNIIYNSKIYATNKYIYALMYNRSIKELKEKTYENIPYILVWDWECNLVKKIKLDLNITSFTVSENDSILYGVSQFVEDKIFTINL